MADAMKTTFRRCGAALAPGALALALAFGGQAQAAAYPDRAPIEHYLIANSADEIALARSAAPASISSHAEVQTLGAHGYETAVKGDNGFVCLVLRSWASGVDDAGFWNPKMRGPICLNAAAVRTVLPLDLWRAQWALAGDSREKITERTKAAIAAHKVGAPEVGAMSYMMSKDGYLNDEAGHWHPHLMFFLPRMATADWGANVKGGAVLGDNDRLEPVTIFYVPLTRWSDGSPATMGM